MCPEACFEKLEAERKVELSHDDRCVRCGACVVQCPQDALFFEDGAGSRIEPETIRRFKLNLMGRVDSFKDADFDSAVLSLCLSEMSAGERRFVLGEAAKCLAPGGKLVVADEVRAKGPIRRGLQLAGRGPQWLLAWLLAGGVSTAIPDLRSEIEATGLGVVAEQFWLQGGLALYVARALEPAGVL